MNVLAFKLNATNKAEFEKERAKVNLILKDKKVPATDEVCVGKEGASVSFVGTDDHIEEFVFFANRRKWFCRGSNFR
jgi:hypothetical protein